MQPVSCQGWCDKLSLDFRVFLCYIITMMSENYKPTIEQRTRMMSAIESELERENPNYAHLTITFGMMQHAADEGTHGGHYEYLERLWNMFNLEKR